MTNRERVSKIEEMLEKARRGIVDDSDVEPAANMLDRADVAEDAPEPETSRRAS